MELYNKEFVYFDWDEELDGKKGFFGDNINHLKQYVKDNNTKWYGEICHNVNTITDYPFGFIDDSGSSHCFRFCYYDPYYEFRKAYLEGKQLQFKDCSGNWEDVAGEPLFKNGEYRIKPSNIYYAVWNANNIYCDVDVEDKSKVLFDSYVKEAVEDFIETHLYLHDIIKSAFEGKTIEYKECGVKNDIWKTIIFGNDLSMHDFVHYEYRVKEEEYVPFDTVQELIECWDSKHPSNINRPSDTMPLIWIKEKEDDSIYLITEFYPKRYNDTYDVSTTNGIFSFKDLFCRFTFLNGSIIGKVAK